MLHPELIPYFGKLLILGGNMTFAEAVAERTKELMMKYNVSQYKIIKQTCLDKKTI